MSFNVAGSVELTLGTFGGLVTETPSFNVPEGVSPDNGDVVFTPGGVDSRGGLRRIFTVAFGAPVWAKSFVLPNGNIQNLFLDSQGGMWWEDLTNAPGIFNSFYVTTPGSYAKSITAFGREYIALSDGLHGLDVPIQWDGVNVDPVSQDGPGSPPTVASITLSAVTMSGGTSMTRAANVVTVSTATPHGLQIGYQAQITGIPTAAVGGTITGIVINNEDLPGIATVTTSGAHGLVPGLFVSIRGVAQVAVGGGISSIARAGGVVAVVTASGHNLSPGAVVTVAGVADVSFNTSVPVLTVVSATSFTYAQTDADATSSGGTISLNWPIPARSTPTYFQVQSVPTTTTFQISIAYSNGTWGAGGTVSYAWDGTFFVLAVPTSTTFTYRQYGPNATAATAGKVTPFGQASPGIHQCQVLFLTRNGYTTRPSPPVSFIANGGQYISVSNIPVGPPNVVARILAFTGAGGANFFYLPVPAMLGGQVVSTATQINDNANHGVTLDFSDNTLFAGLGINIPGNNLPNQIVLDGALGFGLYGSRVITWGQRNRIQNLQNMGFEGGVAPSSPLVPTGWQATGGFPGGAFTTTGVAGGVAWQTNGGGSIFQSFYQDAYGAPIGTAKLIYAFRAYIAGNGESATLRISSASTGFSTSATINGTSVNGWKQADFDAVMPDTIPSDMILTLSGSAGAVVDAMSVIYASTPFLDTILYGSYIDNPEAFDGVSGKFGPANDTRKIMDLGIIRNSLYLFTRDPSGRIHGTNDNGVTEPVGWTISEVAANCGLLSAFALTKSQADDSTAGGGEEWLAWASASGARIFGGDQPWKLSQEIQPDWDTINHAALTTIWALNDPVSRVLYFGLPIGSATTPNLIYPMDYKGLDTPYEIAMSPPYNVSASGHLVAKDNARKWTRWHLAMHGASLLYRELTALSPVLLGNINLYVLDPLKLTDDDYGQINPYYTTYFFGGGQVESILKDQTGQPLGYQRKLLQYLTALFSGTGIGTITAYPDALSSPWPLVCTRALISNGRPLMEWAGGNVIGHRIALKFSSAPATGTDNAFGLRMVTVALKAQRHLPVRGSV